MSVAVVNLGGKEYTVTPGQIIDVPHVKKEVGEQLELPDLLHDKKVTASVVAILRPIKVRVIKFKNKTRYLRILGQKIPSSRLKIGTVE